VSAPARVLKKLKYKKKETHQNNNTKKIKNYFLMWSHLRLNTETHNYWVVRTNLPKIIKRKFVSTFPGYLP
jgi:hypothetical protein